MTESWFRREFLTPRRLIFNVLFYGLQLFFFAYGWFSQVSRDRPPSSIMPLSRVLVCRKPTRSSPHSMP